MPGRQYIQFPALALLFFFAVTLLTVGCRSISSESRQRVSVIAFGSCAHQSRDQSFWDPIVEADPDLFIFAGDTIYGDSTNMHVLAEKYATLQASEGYQRVRQACPIVAVWDDHDYGGNDAGSEYRFKEESKQLFLDCFEEPADSRRRLRPGNYDAIIMGPPGRRVQLLLLDTRTFRGPLQRLPERAKDGGPYTAQLDTTSTMLGPAQWTWLAEQLKEPAEVRLLISSIQVVAEDHHWEKWMNFPHERERLLRILQDSGQPGIIVLSGDRHRGEISRMDDALDYPLFDVTSSGLNMSWPNGPAEDNRHRVSDLYGDDNFGLVTIDWDRPDPQLSLELHATSGGCLTRETISLSDLQP